MHTYMHAYEADVAVPACRDLPGDEAALRYVPPDPSDALSLRPPPPPPPQHYQEAGAIAGTERPMD